MIRACIFDLGGTIVDRYSLTPFLSLTKVFMNYNILVPNRLIFKDMGKNKKDHINDILNDQIVNKQWNNRFDKVPDKSDVELLFNDFNKIQKKYSEEVVDVLPETENCINYLQKNNILTGSTTGFNQKNTNIIRNMLERKGIYLNSYVSSTCLNKPSRPYPYMIQENMKNFNITDPRKVIKVDDTVVGINEGLHSNCWTVGVARWSTYMNIQSMEDINNLRASDIEDKLKYSRGVLENTDADFVIDTLDELPKVIEKINSM